MRSNGDAPNTTHAMIGTIHTTAMSVRGGGGPVPLRLALPQLERQLLPFLARRRRHRALRRRRRLIDGSGARAGAPQDRPGRLPAHHDTEPLAHSLQKLRRVLVSRCGSRANQLAKDIPRCRPARAGWLEHHGDEGDPLTFALR